MVTWAFFLEDRLGGEDWRIRVGYSRAAISEYRRFQEESGILRELADPLQWFRPGQLPSRRSRVQFFRLPGVDWAAFCAAPFSTIEGEDGSAGAIRDRRIHTGAGPKSGDRNFAPGAQGTCACLCRHRAGEHRFGLQRQHYAV